MQSLVQREEFARLDQGVQLFAESLARSITSLRILFQETSIQTQRQLAKLGETHIDNQRYNEVIHSLFFPEITSRQEQVTNEFDGIEDSYDWIFEEPSKVYAGDDKAIGPGVRGTWSDFSQWLRSGNRVYWINGKAGSGKSTLMSRICDHEQTKRNLKIWSAEKQLLTPTYFFWNAGVHQQKIIDGLLRSLIYQILKQCRDLVSLFDVSSLSYVKASPKDPNI